jgi:hypothetical protein
MSYSSLSSNKNEYKVTEEEDSKDNHSFVNAK